MEAEPPSFYLKLAFSCIALFLLLLSFISSWKTKENNDVCVFAPLSLSFSNRFSTSSGKKTKQVKMRDSNERALRRLVTKDNAHIASSSFYGLVGEMGIRKNRAASSWTQWDLSHPDFLFCSSSALKTWKETTKKERKWCHLADWFAIPSQKWNKEKKKKILYMNALLLIGRRNVSTCPVESLADGGHKNGRKEPAAISLSSRSA